MNRMVAEIQKAMKEAEQRHKNKFDYDSDEDTEGGTWEHKARMKEMEKTRQKAKELTEMNRGKHHISDFLPPEELEKFIERVKAIKEGRDPGNVRCVHVQEHNYCKYCAFNSNCNSILSIPNYLIYAYNCPC